MNKITWNACKALLSVATPIQKFIDQIPGDTHIFINKQAIKILNNDGYKKLARYYNYQLDYINAGAVWADKGWKNFAHYLDPYNNKGIWPWPDARTECNYHFRKSVKYWHKGKIERSMFYLGAAVHLVQDMCVPHHARGVPLNGHSQYEKWVQHHYLDYGVNSGGCYEQGYDTVNNWIDFNAKLAWNLYPKIAGNASDKEYHTTTTITLSQAQKSTAGFLRFYINQVTNVYFIQA